MILNKHWNSVIIVFGEVDLRPEERGSDYQWIETCGTYVVEKEH